MIGKSILHYKILEKLGEGGMGVVYKAHDSKLKRDVAIKFLPRNIASNTEEKQRFENEAQAAAGLNHPNISTIYSIESVTSDKDDIEVFIVMEYIEGDELKKKIDEGGIKIDQALKITREIAEGLCVAHGKGVIHRDIKSSNIMVTRDGKVKVMDFGLAKVKGSELVTRVGTTIGTAAYMSPEQAQGIKIDQRTDLWSLGVILYEMLTGELPFKAEHEAAWAYTIIHEHPLEPSELDRKIPQAIDHLVMKLLEKEPDKRFESADALLKSLSEAESGIGSSEQSQKTKAIAVLPFNNISTEQETDYFSDCLTEELIMNLSRLKDMRVVSRTTTMQYKSTNKGIKTIGKELGVRYLIEGSVRKFQDKLRITAQLIDVSNDAQIWAETYKGNLADVFDIQEQVSKQIVDALMLKLTPTEKVVLTKRATENTEAFDLYLRARDFLSKLTKNNIEFAIQLFTKAIETDKRYAAAYAGLSEAYAQLYFSFERTEELLEKAIESGLKALMYDPTLSEAYVSLSIAYYNKKLYDDAHIAGQKALELDPDNYTAYWVLGRIYHSMDRDKEAIELYEKAIKLNPDFYSAFADLSLSYERIGDTENQNKVLQKSLEVYPRYLSQHPDDSRAHILYSLLLAKLGKKDEAKDVGKKAYDLSPNDAVMLYNLACLFSRLEERAQGVDYLKKACKSGYQNFEWIKRDPDFDNIRKEPGYIELLNGK